MPRKPPPKDKPPAKKPALSVVPPDAKPAKGTRPPPFTPEDVEKIERMAGHGLTQAMIASIMGVSVACLRERAGGDEALRSALDRGKAVAANTVSEALFDRARGGCIQSIRWWEMSRRNLSEKAEHKHEGELAVTLDLTPEERRREIRKYEAKLGRYKASPHVDRPARRKKDEVEE